MHEKCLYFLIDVLLKQYNDCNKKKNKKIIIIVCFVVSIQRIDESDTNYIYEKKECKKPRIVKIARVY